MRKRMVEIGIKNCCEQCGLIDEWNSKPIVLQIDHINGNPKDNRQSNLRFLCANCHSQTDTFSGKAKRKKNFTPQEPKETYCISCHGIKSKDSTYCEACSKIVKYKIDWDSADIQSLVVAGESYRSIGRMLGISGNAVKKRLRSLGIIHPKSKIKLERNQ